MSKYSAYRAPIAKPGSGLITFTADGLEVWQLNLLPAIRQSDVSLNYQINKTCM